MLLMGSGLAFFTWDGLAAPTPSHISFQDKAGKGGHGLDPARAMAQGIKETIHGAEWGVSNIELRNLT